MWGIISNFNYVLGGGSVLTIIIVPSRTSTSIHLNFQSLLFRCLLFVVGAVLLSVRLTPYHTYVYFTLSHS